MLKAEGLKIRKLIREEEERLKLIEKDKSSKKRKRSDVVVPEELEAELEAARAHLVLAEERLEDGCVRNAGKNVHVRAKAALKKMERNEPTNS